MSGTVPGVRNAIIGIAKQRAANNVEAIYAGLK